MSTTRSVGPIVFDCDDRSPVEDWIGRGKHYVDGVPSSVHAHLDALLAIPTQFEAKLPAYSLPLRDLSLFSSPGSLPELDRRLIAASGSLFSKDMPGRSVTQHIWTRGVPSEAITKEASKKVQQAVLDGMQSFRDPRYQHGLLPLWSISFFERARSTVWAIGQATRALEWLASTRQNIPGAVRAEYNSLGDVESRLLALAWGGPLHVEGAASYMTIIDVLRRLCDDGMLNIDIVDMMLAWTRREATRRHVVSSYVVTTIAEAWYHIAKAKRAIDLSKVADTSWMQKLCRRLEREHGHVLLVSIYSEVEKHFLLAVVDTRQKTLTFGM